ncbi:MAG: 50S ribosomal protein L32 [bacterium]|nr:50S ribosomal protein L32 [bacterium]
MGGVPTKKRTHGKTRRVRSHQALKKTNLSVCGSCKGPIFGHRACPQCRTYGTGTEVGNKK